MRSNIKSDRLSFRFGSFEWTNFFGFPVFLIFIGFIGLSFFFKSLNVTDRIYEFCSFLFCLLSGFLLYLYQERRLKFRRIELNGELEDFKTKVRALLRENQWEIDYDNKIFLQATYRGSVLNLDMLTLKFKNKEILWNIIHHPGSHNSIAAMFAQNRKGKLIMKRIKGLCVTE